MQVTLLGSTVGLFPPRSALNVADTRCQGSEDGIEVFDDLSFTANHHAVTALQAPHPTTRTDIHVVDLLGCEFFGTANVIHVTGIPTINQDIVCL